VGRGGDTKGKFTILKTHSMKLYKIDGEGDRLFQLTQIKGHFGFFEGAGWERLDKAHPVSQQEIQQTIQQLENKLKWLKQFEQII
jgi:hypothetical protein